MAWQNYDDVISQLQAGGLELDMDRFEVGSVRPVRCREAGGDREKRGWYWLSDIELTGKDGSRGRYIVGSFGIYRGSDSGKQNITISKQQAAVSAQELEAIRARQKDNASRMKAMRAAEARRAADLAQYVWSNYIPSGSSDYLDAKGVKAHGVRFSPSGNGTFAVPMCDAAGRVFGLQIVRGKDRGRKLQKEYFPKGLDKKGHFHLIGSPTPGGILLESEGYATAATLHEATGLPVAVAYDAGNLLAVAQALTKAYKNARILVCADDDYIQKCKECGQKTIVSQENCTNCGKPHGQINPGISAAETAALAVSGAVAVPIFPEDRAGAKLTDFNDLANLPTGGTHLVRAQIDAVIQSEGWRTNQAPLRASPIKWAGEDKRRQAVSVLSLDEAVDRFMPIDDGTGKYLWDTWTRKVVQREQMQAILPAGIRGDDIKRHAVWVGRGAVYIDQIGFDPTEKDTNVLLNTWRGWPIEPKAGECHLIIALIEYLCGNEAGSKGIADWLIKWMAYPLQHPGAKMSSAVIMHGPQGTGKSAIFQTLARIYGDYSTVLNQRGLEDKFNSDWADSKLFILAEEVVTRAEMWHIKNELKELVTGEWIRVNPKNVAAYRQRNQLNIVYLSNEGQPLPIDNDDRRHLVVWTPPKLEEDFYDAVWAQIENGGVAALYHHLMNLDLGDFHPKKRPPWTQAKADLIDLSKPSEQRFIDEWIDGELDLPLCPCASDQIYRAYEKWCKQNGVRNQREKNQFLGQFKRMEQWQSGPFWMFETTHYLAKIRRRMVIPPGDLLEKHKQSKPQDKTAGQWLTDSFFFFKRAMERRDDPYTEPV